MGEERRRVLDMLANGKIDANEAERLLDALAVQDAGPRSTRRYLRVAVEEGENTKVNVRVPLELIRAGIKLRSFIPETAAEKVDASLEKHGIAFGPEGLKSGTVDEFLKAFEDLTVDVADEEDGKPTRVRVFCE